MFCLMPLPCLLSLSADYFQGCHELQRMDLEECVLVSMFVAQSIQLGAVHFKFSFEMFNCIFVSFLLINGAV